MAISEEVAAAMKLAREMCGKTPEQFAREINRVAGWTDVTADDIEAFEERHASVLAEILVAAARLAEQPVSSLLGELTAYTAIAGLERRLGELEARLEAAGLGPTS